MSTLTTRIEALADTAADWRDAAYAPRQSAVEETLDAPNRWTEQALDHALDRWMEQLTVEGLNEWIGTTAAPSTESVIGVLHGEEEPLAGLRDAVAVWALGFDYVGAVPDSSPALLPAFADDLRERLPDPSITFTSIEETLAQADAVIADPLDRVDASVAEVCEDHVPPDRRHIRAPQYSVGLVDGHETDDEMGRLAEDMLLFEGKGRRRLALLWAPDEHSPDLYLEAMAGFRGLFPAHEETPGTLQMQQAFLEAQDQPHAYAEGLEFLVSRGDPELQKPGHIRWSEYEELDAVDEWWRDHREEVYAVIARPHLHDQCPDEWPLRAPGGVHIPPLDDAEGEATVRFLRGVGTEA